MKQYHYEQVEKPKKNAFDLSHEKKFTMNIGELVPCYLQEVIPGDKIKLTQEMLMRNMPLIAPMMHRVNVFTHFFFVPNRIIFPDWDRWIAGEAEDIGSLPTISESLANWKTHATKGSLCDHMGLPVTRIQALTTSDNLEFNIMPFWAYQMIYNEYYRDQNLQVEVMAPFMGQGNMQSSSQVLYMRTRNLEKDYFTSGLPSPQFGEPVTLPIAGSAPVTAQTTLDWVFSGGTTPAAGTADFNAGNLRAGSVGVTIKDGELSADLSLATAATVSDLRRAFALQRYQEKLMRGGRRFKEFILNIFGVNIPDARIQRPEYLGGGKMPLQISEVLSTYGASDTELPLGNMAGHGVAGGEITGFNQYFYEHGYIIGIMSILPKTGYFQGVPKDFIKFSPYDFYTPDMAHIGEQAIKQMELYLESTKANNEKDFAYTPRYAEYRDRHDTVAGEFRDTLKHWHMAKEFANSPSLNEIFIRPDASSTNRVFAVQGSSYPKFVVQTYLKILAIRGVSKFGNPI